MKRYLITGGAGFIGAHLARALIARGDAVDVIDNLSTGRRENLAEGSSFFEIDLAVEDFPHLLPAGPYDAVVHLAAQSSGEASHDDPVFDVNTNALSTLRLSRWCLKTGITRFVYASSMAAYGQVEDLPAQEDTACHPLSYYGVSKLSSEHFLRLAAIEGLSCTSLRFFSVYGPGQNLDNLRQGMASIYLAYLLRGAEVPVTGSLDRFRDLVYVSDCVDALIRCLDVRSTPSAVYNVAGGRRTTVRELLASLISALALPADHPVSELAGSPNDQFGMQADISLIERELGWRPSTPLSDGISAMVNWARDVQQTVVAT